MKKQFKKGYYDIRLYCDNCGTDISDLTGSRKNNSNVKTETLYKTKPWIDGGTTSEIVGKKFTCLKCGTEYIEDEYEIYPIQKYIYTEGGESDEI